MYEKTQYGWVIIFVSLLAIGYATYHLFRTEGTRIGSILIIGILLVTLLMFYKQTVRVDSDTLSVKLGIGLITRSYSLQDISSCQPVRNKWWYGWGIRRFSGGVLFTVSGLDAIELTFARKTKKVRIGTDDSSMLAGFVEKQLANGA